MNEQQTNDIYLGENSIITTPKVLFTSDSHFYHHNIIKYCNRPFRDVDEMNCEIVKRYREKVNDNDIVYFLGDFGMAPRSFPISEQFYLFKEIMDELPGRKFLIRGNHDSLTHKHYLDLGFEQVRHVWHFKEQNLVLTHNPEVIRKSWAPKGNFRWIAGHVHDLWKFHSGLNCLNVSVDVHDFYPITWEEVKSFFKKV